MGTSIQFVISFQESFRICLNPHDSRNNSGKDRKEEQVFDV